MRQERQLLLSLALSLLSLLAGLEGVSSKGAPRCPRFQRPYHAMPCQTTLCHARHHATPHHTGQQPPGPTVTSQPRAQRREGRGGGDQRGPSKAHEPPSPPTQDGRQPKQKTDADTRGPADRAAGTQQTGFRVSFRVKDQGPPVLHFPVCKTSHPLPAHLVTASSAPHTPPHHNTPHHITCTEYTPCSWWWTRWGYPCGS